MTTEDLVKSMDDIQGRYQQGQLDLEQLMKLTVDLGRAYESFKYIDQINLQLDLIEKEYKLITDPDKKGSINLEKRMIVSQGRELINGDGMKSVGMRCSNLSNYHNVCNGLKCSINHGCPTVLYRVLPPVFSLRPYLELKNITHLSIIKSKKLVCITHLRIFGSSIRYKTIKI